MPPDAPYAPPLTLTPALLNRVAAIAEALGRWSARQDALPSALQQQGRLLRHGSPRGGTWQVP